MLLDAAEDLDESGMSCRGCNQEMEKCECLTLLQTINEVNEKLLDLELLDRLAGQSMTFLVQIRIKEHIKNTCVGVFDRSHLKNLLTVSHSLLIF